MWQRQLIAVINILPDVCSKFISSQAGKGQLANHAASLALMGELLQEVSISKRLRFYITEIIKCQT